MEKTQFIWRLCLYKGGKDSIMMGKMIMSEDQLDQNLTTNYLIKQLNSRNIFDFDYSPCRGWLPWCSEWIPIQKNNRTAPTKFIKIKTSHFIKIWEVICLNKKMDEVGSHPFWTFFIVGLMKKQPIQFNQLG